jgi:amino acid adenylation domain-containing protein
MSFAEAASHVSEAIRMAVAHKVPFERLQEDFYDFEFAGPRALIHVIHGHWPGPALRGDRGQWTVDTIRHVQAHNESDILFTTIENDDEVLLSVEYPPTCIGREVIEAAASHFSVIAAQIANGLPRRLRDIALYTQDELARLSAPYADDESEHDQHAIHDLISSVARLKPDAPAIFFGDEAWTHGELKERANRLAHRLAAFGAGAERCIAVALRRSPEAIMAILAVLKSGSAFVPINPDHPPARNSLVLSDAGVSIVLTTSHQRSDLPELDGTIILEIDRLDLSAELRTAPKIATTEAQLAYVIYTSGSTGQPKGVAVEHGPLSRHCQSTARVYEVSANSRELAFLPFRSDGGHERWIVPLMVGGSVVLPTGLWTPAETFLAMRRFGVNNASFPTSYLQQLAEWAEATGDAPPVRLYSFGGEGLPQSTFDLLSRALKAEWLINGYGPTEAIMTPMVWKVRPGVRFDGLFAPIGRAVGRRNIYILDDELNPVPIGVEGELYIVGDGLARDYVSVCHDSERFCENPFKKDGSRLYRTGDRARWLKDGVVEFLGRADHQVKLRGFRIELGEIEARLRTQPVVKDCAVVLRKDSDNPTIVAYIVPTSGITVDPTAVRDALLRQLPDYMVPSAVVCLETLPLNANSKVDRAALPAPESVAILTDPPETETEIFLASIWQDVLGLSRIGVTQNFFEIGGHSMAALRILSRIKLLRPAADVTIADLFNHQDIRALAAIIDRPRGRADDVEMIHLRRSGSRPLLYCFPGLLVSTREYILLVDYLGSDQPAAGFLCYSLSQEKKMDASVEEITARYAERVRQESKGKPCFFLGWSWGGLLAFEAARMLARDIDLRLIAMVDVCDMDTDFAVGAIPSFKPGERDNLQKRIEAWLSRTPMREDWVHLLGSMGAHAYEQFLRYVGNSEEDLPVDGPDIGSREHTFFVLIDNALIFRRYRMEPFDCPIQAWAAEDSLNRGLNLIDWRCLSPRASAADIVAGTTHLHIIGDGAFHTRLANRLDKECALL